MRKTGDDKGEDFLEMAIPRISFPVVLAITTNLVGIIWGAAKVTEEIAQVNKVVTRVETNLESVQSDVVTIKINMATDAVRISNLESTRRGR